MSSNLNLGALSWVLFEATMHNYSHSVANTLHAIVNCCDKNGQTMAGLQEIQRARARISFGKPPSTRTMDRHIATLVAGGTISRTGQLGFKVSVMTVLNNYKPGR